MIEIPPLPEEEEEVIRDSEFWHDLEQENPDVIVFDGPGPRDLFDSCIVGSAGRINMPPVLVYDAEKMLEKLMFTLKMSYIEADEFLEFNTFGAYLGEHTPLIIRNKK